MHTIESRRKYGMTILVIILVVQTIALGYLYLAQAEQAQSLSAQLVELEQNMNTQIIALTQALQKNQEDITKTANLLDIKVSSLDQEIGSLKAGAGAGFANIIESAIPSVVTVRTNVAQGTGFLITNEGYIVTNFHVLIGGNKLSVITSDQETLNAKLIGYNEEYDVALLKINGTFTSFKFTNEVQIGEKVIAIGNPLGLQFSVTEGIVSAINRKLSDSDARYIQTDAALNPGNSGGPLINIKGRVIGINNFKVSEGESIGFALQSDDIKEQINIIAQNKLNTTLI